MDNNSSNENPNEGGVPADQVVLDDLTGKQQQPESPACNNGGDERDNDVVRSPPHSPPSTEINAGYDQWPYS